MSRPRSDSSLRRLVVELADLPTADRTAILDALDDKSRRSVEELLEQYRGQAESLDAPPFDGTPFSPWLHDRMARIDEGRMTSHARQVLRESAAQIFPPRPYAEPKGAAGRPTLVDRVGQLFGGWSRV